MAFKLFGYQFFSKEDVVGTATTTALVPPKPDGSAIVYEGGTGAFTGYSIDFDSYAAYANEVDLINQYRHLALQPEVDEAINSIINEMIVREGGKSPISINLDELPSVYDDTFREQLYDQFRHVSTLLNFKEDCHDIARQFYIDGRLYYDLIIDEQNPTEGIVEIRNIDPRMMRPVREVRDHIHQPTGARLTDIVDEYFVYNPLGFRNMSNAVGAGGVRVTKERIAYVNSGVYTPGNVTVLSYLHKAIKPYNQLSMVEDATVIYRITRAPERRVFYVDVADLPTPRAEQYLQSIATRYRNRVVYDSTTGEVRDDRKIQSMLEDYFLPRRSNGRGTEIQTLPAGQNLGEMGDAEYFKRRLYRALGIPVSRLESTGSQFQLGRTTEITRDEIQFARFLDRLRNRLAKIFDEILSRHLVLTGTIRSIDQWTQLRQYIHYEYASDSYFAELKAIEVMKERLEVLSNLDSFVGKYFSEQYVMDNVLRLTSAEQAKIKAEIAAAGGGAVEGGEGMGEAPPGGEMPQP